jgi:CheY-like chemotaxis protein
MLSIRNSEPLNIINKNESWKEIRVLMVEDERDQLELAKVNLEKRDSIFRVIGANTPSEAIKCLKTCKPDCIVSDYVMPEMDGIRLYASIKEQDIPYLLYTGRGSEEVAKAAFFVGIDDYVRKDASLVHFDYLARRIKVAVDKKRSEHWYQSYSTQKYRYCKIWRA